MFCNEYKKPPPGGTAFRMMSCVVSLLFVNDFYKTSRASRCDGQQCILDGLDETGVSCDVSVMYFIVSARPY